VKVCELPESSNAPPTLTLDANVVAPVTVSAPAIAVLPVAAVTVNFPGATPTIRFPVMLTVPATVRAAFRTEMPVTVRVVDRAVAPPTESVVARVAAPPTESVVARAVAPLAASTPMSNLPLTARVDKAVWPVTRGLHSSTFQLNLSAFCGIGGAFRGCLRGCMGC